MASEGDGGSRSKINGQVYKTGHLFVSSKGLGWKSWKRRWFLLTRTSLIFFKTEPRGAIDGSLALGGIDLNNSGSVHVRADKKLLTVMFPDGRAFTLKADTSEDLEEWKSSLETALAEAPAAALFAGQGNDGIFRADSFELSGDFSLDGISDKKKALRSLVVGRPVLLALEEIDGSPSFLEKALRYLEIYGCKVQGILRESADVEAVEKRVKEYEQGRLDIGEDENAHVIGDCVKHVLRELPSHPVPTPCCTALLLAWKAPTDKEKEETLSSAIFDTFPEPNRRLMQRLLHMMKTIAENTEVNLMTTPAVAACMAPLLLRPLVSGECILTSEEDDADADDEVNQIMAAAQAANQAHSITGFLMDHYSAIFTEELNDRSTTSRFFGSDLTWGEDNEDDDIIIDDDDLTSEANFEFSRSSSFMREAPSETGASSEPGSSVTGNDTMASYWNLLEELSKKGNDMQLPSPGSAAAATGTALAQSTKKPGGGGILGSLKSPRGGGGADADGTVRRKSFSQAGNVSLKGVLSWWDKAPSDVSASDPDMRGRAKREKDDRKSRSQKASPRSAPGSEKSSPRPGLDDKQSVHALSLAYEEAQLQVLELTKQDLSSSIARESRANAVLKATLAGRKAILEEQRQVLERDVAKMREMLSSEKATQAVLMKGTLETANDGVLEAIDPEAKEDLDAIGTIERDVVGLQQEVEVLQRQLEHLQASQKKSPVSSTSSERRAKIDSLLSLKAQLQAELERTMSLCREEQLKNAELEEKKKKEDPVALEHAIEQQRSALAEAQSALQAEMARGKDLRRRMQVAQKAAEEAGTPIFPSLDFDESHRDGSNAMPGRNPSVAAAAATSSAAAAQGGEDGSQAGAVLAELSSRLEHFKERRSQLMRQLSSFAIDPVNMAGS